MFGLAHAYQLQLSELHELAFYYPGTHRHVLRYRRFLWACGMPPDPMAEKYRGPSW